MSDTASRSQGEQLIQFPTVAPAHGRALATFRDPYAAYAVNQRAGDSGAGADPAFVLAVFPVAEVAEKFAAWAERVATSDAAFPVYVKARGVEVWWCPGQAVLQCNPEEADALRAEVVEFTFYERELRRLETEIAASWNSLEKDRRLACTVTDVDLRESDAFFDRMSSALERRIRFARLEPHLLTPDRTGLAAAQTLGRSLREEAGVEERAEALDAHLAVFEQVYELASPRMGESRDAHEGQRIEWIIIWLLVAEVVLSLLQVLLKR